eukprot:337737-Hanusia_phi.AAC.1
MKQAAAGYRSSAIADVLNGRSPASNTSAPLRGNERERRGEGAREEGREWEGREAGEDDGGERMTERQSQTPKSLEGRAEF